MAARGVDATSLSAIADEVGIRKASILYHFPNKDALRQAVLDELLSRWAEVLPRLFMATTRDGVARFDAVMGEMVSFFAEDRDRARLLVREQMDRPDELNGYLRQTVRPWIDMIAGTIRDGQQRGMIRKDVDPEAYVLTVVNMSLATFAGVTHAEALMTLEPEGADEPTRDPEAHRKAVQKRCVDEAIRIAKSALFLSLDK
ncbi:MAG: TetR/AcrR family transcriptional regulator [Myxococcota bacterium]|jgi:TetR/AcrR family transcriptional regulator